MMFGRVDEVDGHFVATRFVALTVPTECLYVSNIPARTRQTGSLSGGVRIQRCWRSVAAGYGRVWLPVVAITILVLDVTLGGPRFAVVLPSVVLLGMSVAAHCSGRLSEKEKARLRLLGTVTGLRIDPSMLRPSTREIKRASLGDLMGKGGIPMTPEGILAVLDDIPMAALPLVYGYARYAGDDPEWRECATLIYERHEQGAF
jgi:hypothetical protein